MRLPDFRYSSIDGSPSRLVDSAAAIDVNVSAVYGCMNFRGGYIETVTTLAPCNSTVPEDGTWNRIYHCPVLDYRDLRDTCGPLVDISTTIGYEYSIDLRLDNFTSDPSIFSGSYSLLDWAKDNRPSFWLGIATEPPETDLTPYLSLPVEPEFGWHSAFKTRYAEKRYITSPALWDAITGSDPSYEAKSFFPSHLVRREPLESTIALNPNTTLRATGLIYYPDYIKASDEISFSQFTEGLFPDRMCQVTEEYRTTNAFDVLASIGGLLALLQGFHALLFGRPLFWGLFGGKIITPFGLVGSFATKSFKNRLRERYHYPVESQDQVGSTGSRPPVGIDMTQFLLDYVIDMGPASLPSPKDEDIYSDDSDSEESEYKPYRDSGEVGGVEVIDRTLELPLRSFQVSPSR